MQSFVLSKCDSASLSGFPENSGLKWDHFNSGICGAGCSNACSAQGAGGPGRSRASCGIGGT